MSDPQLEAVLARAKQLQPEELPRFIGQLEEIRVTALARLTAPIAPAAPERLIDVDEASERLGVSKDYLYRHADEYSFTRRQGRKLLFSSVDIDQHIKRG